MANFRTHLSVAALAGVGLAIAGYHATMLTGPEALGIAGFISLGGILPDIDADQSHTVKLVFAILAVTAVIVAVPLGAPHLALPALMTLGGACFLSVRYIASALFRRLTLHRGVWHSLVAGITCGLGVTVMSFHLFESSDHQAWLQGIALLVGFVIHLILDECYSVNLASLRLKRSAGTALKLIDVQAPVASACMLLTAVCLWQWAPPWQALSDIGYGVYVALFPNG